MTATLDLSGLSVVFISYDEPEAEANFAALAEVVPGAARVHGVNGFDAAYRRAGDIARSAHVVTVDGDNRVREPAFFARRLAVPADHLAAVIAFRARVAHNGLAYGNGGVKIWPRLLLRTLRTHEAGRDRGMAVDFAWRVPQVLAQGEPTETRVTGSPLQAFRAGFREGMRLTMHRGVPLRAAFPDAEPAAALARLGAANLERLRIWCSVGRDVEHGEWAILGARTGLVMAAIDGADIRQVADFARIAAWWHEEVEPATRPPGALAREIARLGEKIADELGLLVDDLAPEASRFFKSAYRPPPRFGTILPS